MSSENKILDLIKNDLPRNISEALIEFVNDYTELRKDYEKILDDNKEVKRKLNEFEEDKNDYSELKKVYEEKLHLVKEREMELDKELLSIKLSEADKRNEDIFKLVDKVFGHPSVSVIKNKFGNEVVPKDSYIGSTNSSETTTTTESKF